MADSKPATTQTTKDFVVIADIRDTVLILKDGSLRSILEISSMNFELKSVDEQTAIILAFQNFLNSVDFSLQMAISSRKLDIGPYLKSLDALTTDLTNELLKIQAVEYTRFIRGLTELANIMSKKFYVVVPFYPVQIPTTKAGVLGAIKGIVSPSKFVRKLSDEELENYKSQLNQRIQFIREGISGLGLEAKVLTKDELMDISYSYYNPGHHL